MPAKNIIVGQQVAPEKHDFARRLCREMTEPEQLLWERLRAHRLHGLKFRRQQIVDGFILDFYCHSAGVAVEVDGSVHDDRQRFDEGRDSIMRRRGITVLLFTNDEVRNEIELVLRKIAVACGKLQPLPEAGRGRSGESLTDVRPLPAAGRGERGIPCTSE